LTNPAKMAANQTSMNTLSTLNPFRSASWDPFREIRTLENRLEKFFGRFPLAGNGDDRDDITLTQWSPRVDITEDDKEYMVKAELPELKKEDVKITIENGELMISGERKLEKEEKGRKYHRVELSYGSFLRTFTLPEGVNGEMVVADFKDGVLKIHLPKDPKARPRTLEVKVQ
jgi:HSP20 family protein